MRVYITIGHRFIYHIEEARQYTIVRDGDGPILIPHTHPCRLVREGLRHGAAASDGAACRQHLQLQRRAVEPIAIIQVGRDGLHDHIFGFISDPPSAMTMGFFGRAEGSQAEASCVLIPKTKGEIWLNRVRTWLPPAFVVLALALSVPAWVLWGIPLVVLGEALRTWAAGHLLKDEQLTVGGPYAHVRNPLYLGSLLSGIGFLVIVGNWQIAVAFVAASLAIYLPTVKQEEDYLRRMHGEAFDQYRQQVPAIFPRLRPATLAADGLRLSRFEWRWVVLNKEHKTWVALVVVFALMWLRSAL